MAERVIIIGAGAAGLSCAHRLCQEGLGDRVLVIEAGEHVGGRMGSCRLGDWSVETGPATLREGDPGLLSLIDEIGLAGDVVFSASEAQRRYLFRGGRLRVLPSRPPQILGTDVISTGAKLRLLCEPLIPRKTGDEDETVGAFMRRRLGREVAEQLVDAAVGGIFAGDIDRLSLRSVFPKVWEMERQHGSLLVALLRMKRAKPAGPGGPKGVRLLGFREGMGQLSEALARAITQRGGSIACGSPAMGLARDAAGFRVRTPRGEHHADRVVLALPPPQAAALLGPLDATLADAYRAIPMAPVIAISLGYQQREVPHPLDGFGFLVPRSERIRLLGALFMTTALPGYLQAPAGHVLIRAMYGGAHDQGIVGLTDEALLAEARRDLKSTLGIEAAPRFVHTQRWTEGIEQYLQGHSERVRLIEERLAALGLCGTGAALHGISVPDVLRDGTQVAQRLLAAIDR